MSKESGFTVREAHLDPSMRWQVVELDGHRIPVIRFDLVNGPVTVMMTRLSLAQLGAGIAEMQAALKESRP